MGATFADRIDAYTERVDTCLDLALPESTVAPYKLHEAMRYAVLSGGKRVRPLLVYAAGECMGVDSTALDAPAAALELIHSFSLIHDDLPAMDDDDLRRGRPTVHRRFDEAIAILAGDALLPLAFQIVADSPHIATTLKPRLVSLIASASGSLGMTGGQAIDLASEGKELSVDGLEHMQNLKTGALIHACTMCACCLSEDIDAGREAAMDGFGRAVGLAFQIRDDLLDVEGETGKIGKSVGSDERLDKATWPAIVGIEESRRRCDELLNEALGSLDIFGDAAEPLRWLANYIVTRER